MSLDVKILDYILDSKVADRFFTAPVITSSVDAEIEKVTVVDENPEIDSVYRVGVALKVYDSSESKEQEDDNLISLIKVSIQVVAKTYPDKFEAKDIEIELMKQSYPIIRPMIASELKPMKINEGILPDKPDFLFT